MKNAIKIIELLNLVYEKKPPKKIKVNDCIYHWDYEDLCYYRKSEEWLGEDDSAYKELFEDDINVFRSLNDEVEILDEQKEIKKLFKCYDKYREKYYIMVDGKICYLSNSANVMFDKLNEVIDAVNKILEDKEK